MTLPNNIISSDYFKVDSLGLSREVIILLANSDRFPIILLYSSCLIELNRTSRNITKAMIMDIIVLFMILKGLSLAFHL